MTDESDQKVSTLHKRKLSGRVTAKQASLTSEFDLMNKDISHTNIEKNDEKIISQLALQTNEEDEEEEVKLDATLIEKQDM